MRNSLAKKAAGTVSEMGRATIDDLLARHPGITRAQMNKALDTARRAKLVELLVRGRGSPGKNNPGIWSTPQAEQPGCIRPPCSVWELAHSRQNAGTWPIPATNGRRHQPLGDWGAP